MITEKQQNIVDAVNALEGDLKNTPCGADVRHFLSLERSGPYETFNDKFTCDDLICTKSEFNQCVKEMSLNGYRQSYLDSYLANTKQLLTKENSYSYYENENKMFDLGQEVTAGFTNEKVYKFGCVNPNDETLCVLFDGEKQGSFLLENVKAKPKTKKVYFVFDKQGLYMDHFQKVRPIFSDELEYQIFEVEVNI